MKYLLVLVGKIDSGISESRMGVRYRYSIGQENQSCHSNRWCILILCGLAVFSIWHVSPCISIPTHGLPWLSHRDRYSEQWWKEYQKRRHQHPTIICRHRSVSDVGCWIPVPIHRRMASLSVQNVCYLWFSLRLFNNTLRFSLSTPHRPILFLSFIYFGLIYYHKS